MTENLLSLLEIEVAGEAVDAVMIQEVGQEECQEYPWEEARPLLDRDLNIGFGRDGDPFPGVMIWTPSRVIFTHNYDGELQVRWLARHPRNSG